MISGGRLIVRVLSRRAALTAGTHLLPMGEVPAFRAIREWDLASAASNGSVGTLIRGWAMRGYSSDGAASISDGPGPVREAPDPEKGLPPVSVTKDNANTLNELFYLIKMGHGTLPPIEEVLSMDTEGELREQRRRTEIEKQQEISRSRVQILDSEGRAYGTGKRKEAIARVWLTPGTGEISVNKKLLAAYFPAVDWRQQVIMPFVTTGTLGHFDVTCYVAGGGPSGQAQAVRHGISKALQAHDPELRPPLRSAGLLTRDSRVVERKKPGRKKARKSFQWVKR